MTTAMRARIGRLLGWLVVAGALALLLGGLAVPAAARTREEQAARANQFIDLCFREGGDPEVLPETDGAVRVVCRIPGHGGIYCNFSMEPPCWSYVGPRPIGPHRGVGGPADGGVIDSGQSGTPTPLSGPVPHQADKHRKPKHGRA